jgi:hypothetical protein
LVAECRVCLPCPGLAVDQEAAVDAVEKVAHGQVGAAGVYLRGATGGRS